MLARPPLTPFKLVLLGIAALAGIALLVSLGSWQVRRLVWKRDLIQRVDARVHGDPVAAPGPERWAEVNAANSEYLRVRLQGHYLHDKETLVQAVTELGPGFWVLTPLVTAEGMTVLVNRGYVPPPRKEPASRPSGQLEGDLTVIGLLRISEPKGGFMRENDVASDHWFSRDVAAIASARGLDPARTAPYFVDAEALSPDIPGAPRGGLTVIAFPNNHLQYAITWFVLALMLGGGAVLVFRHESRLRRLQAS